MILCWNIRAVWPNIDFDGTNWHVCQSFERLNLVCQIFTDRSSDVVVIILCSKLQSIENITPLVKEKKSLKRDALCINSIEKKSKNKMIDIFSAKKR